MSQCSVYIGNNSPCTTGGNATEDIKNRKRIGTGAHPAGRWSAQEVGHSPGAAEGAVQTLSEEEHGHFTRHPVLECAHLASSCCLPPAASLRHVALIQDAAVGLCLLEDARGKFRRRRPDNDGEHDTCWR